MSPKSAPLLRNDVILFLGLLSLLPLFGAIYGTGNQVEQLSLIARLKDPSFAQGDFYIDASIGFGPRYYFSVLMAQLSKVIPLPLLVHTLTVLSTFALAGVTFLATQRFVNGGTIAGLLAAILVVTNQGFSLGLAGFLRFDSFQPANLAIPLALWGLYFHWSNRLFLAAPFFAVATMMHPLIGIEIAMLAYGAHGIAALILPPETGRWTEIRKAILAGLLFSTLVAATYLWPMSQMETIRLASEDFFAILAVFRAPHHYLGLDFPRWSVVPFGIFLAALAVLFFWASGQKDRTAGLLPLAIITALVLLACAASLWFVDVAHNRLWTTAQVFRMLMVVKWVAFILLSQRLAILFETDRAAALVLIACAIAATADAQPRVMLTIVFALIAMTAMRHLNGRFPTALKTIIIACAALVSVFLIDRYATPIHRFRGLLAFALLLGILALPQRAAVRAAITAALIALLAVTFVFRENGFLGWGVLRAKYSLEDHRSASDDISRRAQDLSKQGSIWVIPLEMELFRNLSNRAVAVDFTSIPFDDQAMAEWKRRIDLIYGQTDKSGSKAVRAFKPSFGASTDWPAITAQLGATHAVLPLSAPWSGLILYQNKSFKAVALFP